MNWRADTHGVESELPEWLHRGCGKSDVLVLAPHGGLSHDNLLLPASWPRKGNDLHTAELAAEIAHALDASFVINTGLDRNRIDLNRIEQIATHAPFFAAAIADALGAILAEHARCRVLILHGWHIQQDKADFGVGATLPHAAAAYADPERLTCTPDFIAGPLEELRGQLGGRGIESTFGERWPGAHRNNLLQAFRAHGGAPVPEALAPLRRAAATGRIDAVQLELSVPLRWPGTPRRNFIASLQSALSTARAAADPIPAPAPDALPELRRAALQCTDRAANLLILAGMACLPDGSIGCRFLFFLPDGRVGIFTGHGRPRGRLAVHGFSFRQHATGLALSLASPVQLTDDPIGYFRFEAAQQRAEIVQVRAELEESGGRVRGELVVSGAGTGNQSFALDARALPQPLAGRPTGLAPGLRFLLAHEDGTTEQIAGDLSAGSRQSLCDGRVLRHERVQTAALLRHEAGRAWRCEFGPARFLFDDGRSATGLFEAVHPA